MISRGRNVNVQVSYLRGGFNFFQREDGPPRTATRGKMTGHDWFSLGRDGAATLQVFAPRRKIGSAVIGLFQPR